MSKGSASGHDPAGKSSETDGTVLDDDIGDDWGEAFEAEDFLLDPEEGDVSEFFLEDDAETLPAESESGEDGESEESGLSPLHKLLSWAQRGWGAFRSLSLVLRVVIVCAAFALPVSFWLFSSSSGGESSEVKGDNASLPKAQDGLVKTSNSASSEVKPEAVKPPAVERPTNASPSPEVPPPPPAVSSEARPPVRVSWRLPPLLIPAQSDDSGMSFLSRPTSLWSLPTRMAVCRPRIRNLLFEILSTNSFLIALSMSCGATLWPVER